MHSLWAGWYAGYPISPSTCPLGVHSLVEIQERKRELEFKVVGTVKEETMGHQSREVQSHTPPSLGEEGSRAEAQWNQAGVRHTDV